MFNTEKAFKELKKTYKTYMLDKGNRLFYCPPKTVQVERTNPSGLATRYVNTMGAHTKSNEAVRKRISIDDDTGEVEEDVLYADGRTPYHFLDVGITPVRCGLMTCLAIDLLSSKRPKSVGYIGCGRINLENCKAIRKLFGDHTAIIRGSRKDRYKNKHLFEEVCSDVCVDDTESLSLLDSCDVVVVCTTSNRKEDMIENELLRHVPLVIALDSGYLLGESFRTGRTLYTDHEEQLDLHYFEEFPYDEKHHSHENMKEDHSDCKKLVSLFGIALADLVTTKHFIKGGLEW